MAIGSYAVERDYSHYVAYLSKTALAVVGTATRGPIDEAVECTSTQDLINKFGPLKTNCYALYAGQYFLSQSSKLYFVRASSDSASESSVEIEGVNVNDTTITDALTISTLEKGTYGNGYTVEVSEGTVEGTYKLVIKDKSGLALETHYSFDLENASGYTSKYIKVSAVNPTAAALTEGVYTFDNGNDGISGITASDYNRAADALLADVVDINLISVPGVSDPSVVNHVLSIAETRGDCLYIIDPPRGLTKDGVISWHNGGDSYEHTIFNSSYGALYYDWVTIYDSVNKTRVQVPPSVPVAASIAYSDRVSDVWYAPAGLNRGIIRGVLNANTKLNKSDVALLYDGNNCINPIYDDPQVGLVLWGQKTLQRQDTALNRINVRRLMNYLKKVVKAACDYLVFEPNDRVTWNAFEMKVQPVLEAIKNNRGLYEYSVVRGKSIVTDEDIDNYRMPCMIMIRPTKSAEEIPIYFTITSTGADFNDVLDSSGLTDL